MTAGIVAFQGVAGAYSDIACRTVYPRAARLPCPTFLDVFEALKTGRADHAMIPIDNTIAGRVADIHYLLPRYRFSFVGEYFLPVDHCLLGVAGATVDDITTVLSHPHALPQCRRLIRQRKWAQIACGDTASAAQRVAQEGQRHQAAIASALTAQLYGLKILRRHIADEKNNITRFLALSRHDVLVPRKKNTRCITSILFRVRNIAAALYKAMGGFATNGVNMLKIESYMPDGSFASTLFYAEVEGHAGDAAVIAALDELAFFATDIRVLGSYAQDASRHRATGKPRKKTLKK